MRSERSGELIPLSNLVSITEQADSQSLNRYNRIRAITLEANLADDLALGDALSYLEAKVRELLPEQAQIDYKGQSRDFRDSAEGILFVFVLGLVVVFLVLAAQFETWVHPFVIMLTVPLAMAGALLGLWLTGQTLNIYSQIGLIMLVGLSAKNGILIVEFANQLRDQGKEFHAALMEAADVRLRPIVMTGITTAAGSRAAAAQLRGRRRDPRRHRHRHPRRRAGRDRLHAVRRAGRLRPARQAHRLARRRAAAVAAGGGGDGRGRQRNPCAGRCVAQMNPKHVHV